MRGTGRRPSRSRSEVTPSAFAPASQDARRAAYPPVACEWLTPVSMTSSSSPAASKPSGTISASRERQSRNTAESRRPSSDADWSMMPVGAPTATFSASWPTRASSAGRARGARCRSARVRRSSRWRPTTTARRPPAPSSRGGCRSRAPLRGLRPIGRAPTRRRADTRPSRRAHPDASSARSISTSSSAKELPTRARVSSRTPTAAIVRRLIASGSTKPSL